MPGNDLAALTLAALVACTPAVTAPTSGVASNDPIVPWVRPDPLHDRDWFAAERAIGAECDSAAVTDAPLEDTACYGSLPEHVASLLRNLPDSHPFLSAAERREAASTQQKFKAVGGLGKRRDVVAVIQHFSPFWVRSFEGSDPETTVYLVYGPDCDAT